MEDVDDESVVSEEEVANVVPCNYDDSGESDGGEDESLGELWNEMMAGMSASVKCVCARPLLASRCYWLRGAIRSISHAGFRQTFYLDDGTDRICVRYGMRERTAQAPP